MSDQIKPVVGSETVLSILDESVRKRAESEANSLRASAKQAVRVLAAEYFGLQVTQTSAYDMGNLLLAAANGNETSIARLQGIIANRHATRIAKALIAGAAREGEE